MRKYIRAISPHYVFIFCLSPFKCCTFETSPSGVINLSYRDLTLLLLVLFFLFYSVTSFTLFNLHTSLTPFSHRIIYISSSLPFPSLTGTDLGGLFKDFLTDLSARVFDPSYGLFLVTSDNLLYPNPSAILLYPEPGELEALYSFLGTYS